MLTLGFVLETLTDYQPTGDEPTIASVVIDSRLVRPGSLFIAFTGENVDGHDFVPDAFQNGAVAALIERPIAVNCSTIDTIRPWDDNHEPDLDLTIPLCILVGSTLPIQLPDGLFGLTANANWIVILFIYAAIASMLPVWVLLQPRDYINGMQLIVGLVLHYLLF